MQQNNEIRSGEALGQAKEPATDSVVFSYGERFPNPYPEGSPAIHQRSILDEIRPKGGQWNQLFADELDHPGAIDIVQSFRALAAIEGLGTFRIQVSFEASE